MRFAQVVILALTVPVVVTAQRGRGGALLGVIALWTFWPKSDPAPTTTVAENAAVRVVRPIFSSADSA